MAAYKTNIILIEKARQLDKRVRVIIYNISQIIENTVYNVFGCSPYR